MAFLVGLTVAGIGSEGGLEGRPLPNRDQNDPVGEETGGEQHEDRDHHLARRAGQEAGSLVGVDHMGLRVGASGHPTGGGFGGGVEATGGQVDVDGTLAARDVGDLVLVLDRLLHPRVEGREGAGVGRRQVLPPSAGGQAQDRSLVEVATLEADREHRPVGTLDGRLGLIERRGRHRVLPVAEQDDVGLEVGMVGEEPGGGAYAVEQGRLSGGGQAVDALVEQDGVVGEVDDHPRLAAESHHCETIVRLALGHELTGGGLGRVELAVLVHRAGGVEEEDDPDRSVRAPDGNGVELVDDAAVLPQVEVGQVGGRPRDQRRDHDGRELGGVDRPDRERVGKGGTSGPGHRQGGQGQGAQEPLHRLAAVRRAKPSAWKSSAPSLTP